MKKDYMDVNVETFASLRGAARASIADLSALTGLALSKVYSIANGSARPTADEAREIAASFSELLDFRIYPIDLGRPVKFRMTFDRSADA